jgi:hypothetical protein
MIAHVAQEGEDRGRVVLSLGATARTSDVALEAAVRVAQAFQSGLENLFIEDDQLFDLASFSFSRETAFSGRTSRELTVDDIEREMEAVASYLDRKVVALARAGDVPVRSRVIRDDPLRALAVACAECGPWNVVTLSEPYSAAPDTRIGDLFRTVHGTTGVVLAGPNASRTHGRVVAIVEEIERALPMLRAAERLAGAMGSEPLMLIAEEGADRLAWMEGQIRLALGGQASQKLEFMDLAVNDTSSVSDFLRREQAGFVLLQFGGRLAADEAALASLASLLDGPLFLVR